MRSTRSLIRKKAIFAACTMLLAAGLSGCASNDAAKLLNPDPPGKMYSDADAMLTKGQFESAAKKFEDLDRDHPYAQEARRAMVMAGFAYYRAKKYPEAIAAARRYTTLHPGTKDAALAHHIIASSYFDEIKDPTLDQTASRRALTELKLLATRYPDSQYARQAENRIRIAEDSVAASEMVTGRYYLKQHNHVAAINRFKTVVTEHQTTQHVEEALMRLTEAYLALGIVPEAQTAAAVLGHNYPDSKWYQSSFALLNKQGLKPQVASSSWLSQQWQKVVPGAKSAPKASPDTPPTAIPPAQVPAPREDLPTASTTRPGKPMGLTTSTN